jgi:hypothetical protein
MELSHRLLLLLTKIELDNRVCLGRYNGKRYHLYAISKIDTADIHLNPEYDNVSIFYAATVNSFDHSQTVREYFHNNRSRINPNNKSLWPLCHQAYKEFGI